MPGDRERAKTILAAVGGIGPSAPRGTGLSATKPSGVSAKQALLQVLNEFKIAWE
jgi:hypothetical protein